MGAFNMIRREVYDGLGGWEALRMEVLEDLTLGRRVKQRAYAQRVAFGVDMVNVRWARGAFGVVDNLTKNLFALFRFRPEVVFAVACGISLFTLFPLLACLAGPALWWPTGVMLIALLLAYQLTGKYQHFSAAQMLLFPSATFLLLYAMLRSMLLAIWRGGIVWRGTFYPTARPQEEGREVKPDQEQFGAEGFVLAGGRSTRMGQDKALLPLAGRSLLDIALDKLRSLRLAGAPRIVAARSDLSSHAEVIADLHPGCGPLSGIEAALAASTRPLNVFLPVDLPLLPAHFLLWMLQRAETTGAVMTVPRMNGWPQPLCAVYHRDLLGHITASLRAGDYKVMPVMTAAAGAHFSSHQSTSSMWNWSPRPIRNY